MEQVIIRFPYHQLKGYIDHGNQDIGILLESENKVQTVGDALLSILDKINESEVSDWRYVFSRINYYLVEEFGLDKVFYASKPAKTFFDRITFSLVYDKDWIISQVAILPSPETYFSRKKRATQKVKVTEADKQWVRKYGFDSVSFGGKLEGQKAII